MPSPADADSKLSHLHEMTKAEQERTKQAEHAEKSAEHAEKMAEHTAKQAEHAALDRLADKGFTFEQIAKLLGK
jgi:SOS response regulatory protein OraA/RecX